LLLQLVDLLLLSLLLEPLLFQSLLFLEMDTLGVELVLALVGLLPFLLFLQLPGVDSGQLLQELVSVQVLVHLD